MSEEVYETRFSGVARVLGKDAAELLKQSHIMVVGLGGVGSWSVEALVRSGVGKLTLVDGDVVSESNINRQLPALSSTLGQRKCEVLKQRVEEINPDVDCTVLHTFVDANNLSEIISVNVSGLVDAIDSIKPKAALIAYCRRNKIPLVTTGGAGGLSDPTRIQVADLSNTVNDPLAAKLRQTLRRDYGFPSNSKRSFSVPCVFSDQASVYPKEDGSVSQEKPGVEGLTLDCHFGYGAFSPVTAGFGFTAAATLMNKLIHKMRVNGSND